MMLVNRMDKKQLYTTSSRTTKLEYIHLNNKKLKIKCTKAPYIKMESVNSYSNDDYNSGQIYQIIFEHNDKVYVGCSIRNLQTRLQSILPIRRVQFTSTKMIIRQPYLLYEPRVRIEKN